MKKSEIIEILVENYNEDQKVLISMKKEELEELLEEYSDDSIMFPNGHDYDAEDWDD